MIIDYIKKTHNTVFKSSETNKKTQNELHLIFPPQIKLPIKCKHHHPFS